MMDERKPVKALQSPNYYLWEGKIVAELSCGNKCRAVSGVVDLN